MSSNMALLGGICSNCSEQTPSPTSFPQFQRLPPELQDMIWRMAMRGSEPSFHAFFFRPYGRRFFDFSIDEYPGNDVTIFGYNCQDTRSKWDNTTTRAFISRPRALGNPCVFMGPEPIDSTFLEDFDDKMQGCWHEDNKSKYLQDYGLWTACKSSRLSMTRYHLKRTHSIPSAQTKQAPVTTAPRPLVNDGKTSGNLAVTPLSVAGQEALHRRARKPFSAAITGSFRTEGSGTPQMFHIAKQDLVLIQCDFRWHHVRSFSLAFHGSIRPAFVGVENLAVEYESWMVVSVDRNRRRAFDATLIRDASGTPTRINWIRKPVTVMNEFLIEATGNDWTGRRVWFIDHGIKRRQGAAPIDQPSFVNEGNAHRQIFYGRGCRFIEVGWDDYHPGLDSSCGSLDCVLKPCGAPAVLRTFAKGLDPNAQGKQLDDLCRWLSSVPFGILAVEDD